MTVNRDQPVLEAARLLLRPFQVSDAAAVERLAGAREVAEMTLSLPHPYPPGGGAQWIETHGPSWESGSSATYAVVERETGTLVGAIGLAVGRDHALAELGYWIGVPYWNRGYATEAARRLVDFGFAELDLNRIQARHFTRNPASGRVLQKIGMRLEGVLRQSIRKWDRFEDVALYAVLAHEWRGLHRAG